MAYSLRVAKELVEIQGLGSFGLSNAAKLALDEMKEKQGALFDIRKDCYLAAAEICKQYDTAESHVIAFNAYRNLPADYRADAIREMKRSLELGNERPFDVYVLGLQMSKANQLDDAEIHINYAVEREPENPIYVVQLAKVLIKQNRLQDALKILYGFREGQYYADLVATKSMARMNAKKIIDNEIIDVEKKIARGYVFKPRNI